MATAADDGLHRIAQARLSALREQGFNCSNLISTTVRARDQIPTSPETRVKSASAPFVVVIVYSGPLKDGRRDQISFEVRSDPSDTADEFFPLLNHCLTAHLPEDTTEGPDKNRKGEF